MISGLPSVDAGLYDEIALAVRRLTGLAFSSGRRQTLVDGFDRAMARSGARDPRAFLAAVEHDDRLLDDLIGEITVGETYFLRDPGQFQVVRDTVLPDLLGHPRAHGLRVWSAGCATGEEVYSLAIVLHEAGLGPRATILGTDISRVALERARAGRYGPWSLRGDGAAVVDTYMRPSGNEVEIIPELRRGVEFRYLNLAQDSYPSFASGAWAMDLIMCRNVLIYFDRDTVAHVAQQLMASLSDRGWLLLGASDPMISEFVPCDVVVTGTGLAYRRRDPGQTVAAGWTSVSTVETDPVMAPPTHTTPPRGLAPASSTQKRPPPEVANVEDPETARAAFDAGAYHAAAEAVERALQSEPDDVALMALRVRALANAGDLSEADRALTQALGAYPTSAPLMYLHAILLTERGHAEAALGAARRAIYLDRTLVVAHLALATAHQRAGNCRGAELALRNAARLLAELPRDALVPESDGEPAGRLADIIAVQISLLAEDAE